MDRDEGPAHEKGQPGAEPSVLGAALFGLCPRCGAKTLFEAPAQVALRCRACALPFGELESSGRFAGLITMMIAVALILIAVGIETAFRPPLLLQALFWAPVTVGVVLYSLRLMKVIPLMAAYNRRYSADSASKDEAE